MWLWIVGGFVLGGVVARRLLRGGGEPGLGTVSAEWLATHRAGRRSIE
jgi:hypothetical protein